MKLKGTATVKNIDGGDSNCVLWHDNTLFSGNDNGIIKVRFDTKQIIPFLTIIFQFQAWNIKGDDVQLLAETKAHDYPVYHMISDSKTNQLLSCSSDMSIKYWTNSDGKLTMV